MQQYPLSPYDGIQNYYSWYFSGGNLATPGVRRKVLHFPDVHLVINVTQTGAWKHWNRHTCTPVISSYGITCWLTLSQLPM